MLVPALAYAGGLAALLTMIDKAVTQSKEAQNALRPIAIGSSKYLVAFLHPYQVHQIRTNTNTGQWLDIQKAAATADAIAFLDRTIGQ